MTEFLRRLQYLLHRRRFDAELANDMEFHREMAARCGGATFGNALQLREESREAWGWMWIDHLFQDLRYASRVLRKTPGFTLAAVLMLAIGIGVNVAAFGFFNLMLLRPLPIRDPDSLLRFKRTAPEKFAYTLPYQEMAFFRENSKTLSAVLASHLGRLVIDGEEKPLNAHFVTANFFSELGDAASVGRLFMPARDGVADADPVVVLSYGFWQRHFGADLSIAGKTVHLNGKPATVIGVASNESAPLSLDRPDLWLPLNQQPYFVSGSHLLTDYAGDVGVRMWGRLQPGLAPMAAENELRSLAAELHKQHPNEIWEKESLLSMPGGFAKSLMIGDRSGSGTEPPSDVLPVVSLIGVLVLLILCVACSNLGSLLFARGVARQREIAIRVAVGAGSGRLIRQLFAESLLLALLGAAAGLAVGYAVLRTLIAMTEAPSWFIVTPDWRVIFFAIGIGCAAAILFGLTPALQLARQRKRGITIRQVLIGAQVAGSCVLLIVAGLLIRALDHAASTQPGFEYQRVIAVDPRLATHGYTPAQARTYLDMLENRLRGLPGVDSVSLTSTSPLGGRNVIIDGITVDDHPRFEIQVNRVDPEFFRTMQIPLVAGRGLLNGESRSIVVSQSLAKRLWPGENALGKHFDGEDATGAPLSYTVVGIAGSARLVKLEDADAVEMYYLGLDTDLPMMVALVKTAAAPEALIPSVAAVARAIDPAVIPEVQTLKSSMRLKLQSTEHSALTVSLLGITALVLACLGIVGLVAYAVSQRTKEIGIRMALGAKPTHVLLAVLRQLSRPVLVGLFVGVGGAGALSQLLRRQLYGVSHLDPITYISAVGLFVLTAILAALWPARRALRIDPMRALRQD